MIDYDSTIYLDIITEETAATLNKVRNFSEIRDWCRQAGLIDDIQQANWYKKISSDPTIRMYGICEYADDAPVGICGLTDIDHVNQRAEFSCYIFPQFQKCGYAFNALRSLFKHGFDDLNLVMIWGETFEGNHAYKLFTEKLHMKHEGTRRNFYFKNGQFIDAHLVSISRNEFNAINTSPDKSNSDKPNFDFDSADISFVADKKECDCSCKINKKTAVVRSFC